MTFAFAQIGIKVYICIVERVRGEKAGSVARLAFQRKFGLKIKGTACG
jgi:hypothetical protein